LPILFAAALPFAHASDVANSENPYLKEHIPTFASMEKMKVMDVMHMIDTEKSGKVTKEQYMKFMEAVFDKMDTERTGVLSEEQWKRIAK
jgi:sulfatase maturation enzyme AslB (radical SAM superfamily)